jgi:hypothetical protein
MTRHQWDLIKVKVTQPWTKTAIGLGYVGINDEENNEPKNEKKEAAAPAKQSAAPAPAPKPLVSFPAKIFPEIFGLLSIFSISSRNF